MRKFFVILSSSFFLLIFSLILTLSIYGIETNKFNNLITKKINQSNQNIKLELSTIRFKLDIKKLSLFLETKNPKIDYRTIEIPVKNLRVYTDFFSLFKSDTKIKKINLILNELEISQLKKISVSFKPSNLKSFINNNITDGKIKTEIEFFSKNKDLIDNFIAKGTVTGLKAKIIDGIILEKTNFNFFADKSDILISNFSSNSHFIEIKEGDLKVELASDIHIETNFKGLIKYNKDKNSYSKLTKKLIYGDDISSMEANLANNIKIVFDQTYKLKDYNHKINGDISRARFEFKKPLKNFILKKDIVNFNIKNSKINSTLSSGKKNISLSGTYSLNNGNFQKFNLENKSNKKLTNLKMSFDYDKPFEIELINYHKKKNNILKVLLNLEKKQNKTKINKLNLSEGKNSIIIEDIKFKNDKFISLKKISVETFNNGKKNNDFLINFGKTLEIKGNQLDAKNIPKFLNQKSDNNFLSNLNKDITINLSKIDAPMKEKLKDFSLIGRIEKGKFVKIISKGDFGGGNFIDISMKKNKNDKKKYLEIYSDVTRPLLTEYSFFNGLTGGKIFFSSIIDGEISNSKLKIEKFKVINAPGMVKLLSLADLSGLADLAEGEGLSFDVLEINMEQNKDDIKLEEILAIGPSMSVLLEGYQNSKITSLRGTLVPAKTLNKMISKIPVIGNIVIPKEVGEGLFGISFKMKGPPGAIKTTINPIRTITPRFIQKIIDKRKNPN